MISAARSSRSATVFPVIPGWSSVRDLDQAFCFEWPPFIPRVNVEYATDELLQFTVEWCLPGSNYQAITMMRRLVKDADESYAFHDACFMTDTLDIKRRGFATEMLRRCVPFYYGELSIRRIAIPLAVDEGRVVWPKLGFSIVPEKARDLRLLVDAIHRRELGGDFDGAVPLFGPDLLNLQTVEGLKLGELALKEIEGLALELDLNDPVALRYLRRKGIVRS